MRFWLPLAISLIAAHLIAAEPPSVDLAKIDRTPPKLPALRSEHPEYCLLVFGPDAHKKVWLVQDGNTLYVDRNANGDLSEPDERIAATPDYGDPKDGVFLFKAGDIADGQLTHKDLRLYRFNLDYLKDQDPRLNACLMQNPKWRGSEVQIDLEMPGQHGNGVQGRVIQGAGWHDQQGMLQFGDRPDTAPIVHFAGPWQITFYNPQSAWHAGSTERPYLAVGTPGLGSGTTAFVNYQDVIPPELHPTLKVCYPPVAAGQPSIEKSYDLTRRCCGINLYGNVEVPADIGLGSAHAELSLADWPGVTVASTVYEIPIQAAATSATVPLQPVSARLKQTLPHSTKNQGGTIVEVQFSPDGKRVIAGNYPGGVVNVWDANTAKRLLALDTGAGYRSSYRYFIVSPDWKLIYAPTRYKDRKHEKVEVDGKSLLRWSFDDSVRVFDLETGKLLNSFRHSPPREILTIDLSFDGQYLLSSDGVPGEYESQYRRTASLWNTATGSHREVVENSNGLVAFSPDNKRLAINLSAADASGDTGLKIFDVPDLANPIAINLPPGPVTVWPCQFSPDAKVLAARVEVYPHKGDWQHGATSIKFYDAATGSELFATDALGENTGFYPVKWATNSRTLVAVEQKPKVQHASLSFIDLPQKEIRQIDFGDNKIIADVALHPSGKWIAAAVDEVLQHLTFDDETQWEKLPQPAIQIIDIATGKTLESLVAPQCYIASLAFSPDGKTLATSGPGEVLLWDFSTPPGEH